jgi:transcriptional regulator with XRE-family HTH domain
MKDKFKNPIIVEAIKRAGGTQQQLAAAVGISQCRISKLLGQRKLGMRLSTALKFSEVTGMDISLFTGLPASNACSTMKAA